MPVVDQAAERIYYDESATLEFTATVTAIREVARVEGRQVWQVALDHTAFYPTSGGQPHDTGVLIATSRSGASLEVAVSSVEEDSAGEVWHTTAKPLQEGTHIRGAVDAVRRLDHMQQHSGQHLLSAVLLRDFGAETVSFHLGALACTIDLEGAVLSEAHLASAEAEVNRVVAESLTLVVRYVSQAQAATLLANGVLRKLPDRTGNLRIVEIPGVDVNACGGTHVGNTAQIGTVLLRGTEKVRDATRLTFVCGARAVNSARHDFVQLRSLARSLTTAPEGIAAAIERMQSEGKTSAKERSALLAELATFEAASLAKDGAATVQRVLGAERDLTYAKLLAARLMESTEAKAALIAVPEGERMAVVLAAKSDVVDCGTVLRTALAPLGARGGGNRELAQGAVPNDAFPALSAALFKALP